MKSHIFYCTHVSLYQIFAKILSLLFICTAEFTFLLPKGSTQFTFQNVHSSPIAHLNMNASLLFTLVLLAKKELIIVPVITCPLNYRHYQT